MNKKTIEFILLIYKNPRYKALVQLLFFIIFFAVVILLFNNNDSKKEILNANELYNNMYSYDYECTILKKKNNNNEKIVINGAYGNRHKIIFNNDMYEVTENEVLLDNKPVLINLEFEYTFINHKNIYSKIKNSDLFSKTEFSDSTISKTYKVDYKDEFIEIITYEVNRKIFKVVIDFNDIFDNIEDYTVEIVYSNIK